ncbi:hypothetical protein EVAR_69409_1 [Eumeta japonica]|uniref:Uncharacterized protein n=1 Tax=Eumeta variegata TaxID=151549 RepID=A0A4C1ZCE2_EUMVA|nr:hypothetical protein EVAR_69409_1 [Eumeta japonica]
MYPDGIKLTLSKGNALLMITDCRGRRRRRRRRVLAPHFKPAPLPPPAAPAFVSKPESCVRFADNDQNLLRQSRVSVFYFKPLLSEKAAAPNLANMNGLFTSRKGFFANDYAHFSPKWRTILIEI